MNCDIVIPFVDNLSNLIDTLESLGNEAAWRVYILHRPDRGYILDQLPDRCAIDVTNVTIPADCLIPEMIPSLIDEDSGYLFLCQEDSLLPEKWFSRFRQASEGPGIAAVTPLSNCKTPYALSLVPGSDAPGMDRVIQHYSARLFPDATSGPGANLFFNLQAGRLPQDLWTRGFSALASSGLRVVVADHLYLYQMSGEDASPLAVWQQIVSHLAVDGQYHGNALKRAAWDPRRRAPSVFFDNRPRNFSAALRETGRRFKKAVLNKDGDLFREVLTRHAPRIFSARQESATAASLERFRRPDCPRITYIMSDMVVSGGVYSIVQLVNALTLQGAEARIMFRSKAYEIERWKCLSRPIQFDSEQDLYERCPESDILVATHWSTVEWVVRLQQQGKAGVTAYFLQDYEQWFYPESETATRKAVLESYARIPNRIVKSQWLADLLREDGYTTHKIHFGLDRGLFYQRIRRDGPPRILAMARPNTPRRGFPNVVATLERVYEAMPEVEIQLFGYDYLAAGTIPFPYIDLGVINDFNRLAECYAASDIFFEGSDFQGFGRLSLEAMACGACCVLTNVGGLHEYARHEENCLLVPPKDPVAAADAILRLLRDGDLRKTLTDEAQETVHTFCHKDEARLTLQYFKSLIREHPD